MPSELLTVSEAARRLKLSESQLNRLRCRGGSGSPRFHRLGRAIRYRAEDLDAWLESCAAGSTSEHEVRA